MSAAAAAAPAPAPTTDGAATATATATKSDTITLGSGGVIKKILKDGEGDATPPEGADVEVHYTGTLMDGSKFDSSRDRNDTFHFKVSTRWAQAAAIPTPTPTDLRLLLLQIGKGQVIKGWDVGVASMRKGERAILTCRPDYAYGASGSPPKIPYVTRRHAAS